MRRLLAAVGVLGLLWASTWALAAPRLSLINTARQVMPFAIYPNSLCLDAANQDVCLSRDAANALALANSLTAQRFSVYNTRTDASNYERLNVMWSSDEAYLQTAQAGSGSGRGLTIGTKGNGQLTFSTNDANRWGIGSTTGHLLALSDDSFNIGATSANRPSLVNVARGIVLGNGISFSPSTTTTTNIVLLTPTLSPTAAAPSFAAVHVNPTINGTSTGTA